jgi:hypothetical protein
MSHDGFQRTEPVLCPICGRPLKWMPHRWLSAFVCERCGEFSDFEGGSPSGTVRHAAPLDPEPGSTPSDS